MTSNYNRSGTNGGLEDLTSQNDSRVDDIRSPYLRNNFLNHQSKPLTLLDLEKSRNQLNINAKTRLEKNESSISDLRQEEKRTKTADRATNNKGQ